LSPAALAALMAYPWPGNVRELRNVIERAAMLAESDVISARDLGLPGVRDTPAPPALDSAAMAAAVTTPAAGPLGPDGEAVRLDDVERLHIVRVLAQAGGSRTRAATMLGISRSTLWERGKRYGLF
jgi:two-component system response regulator AtoC